MTNSAISLSLHTATGTLIGLAAGKALGFDLLTGAIHGAASGIFRKLHPYLTNYRLNPVHYVAIDILGGAVASYTSLLITGNNSSILDSLKLSGASLVLGAALLVPLGYYLSRPGVLATPTGQGNLQNIANIVFTLPPEIPTAKQISRGN